MVISIEPETGRLVPPGPEELLRLTTAEATGLLRTAADLAAVRLPDGTILLDLQGRFMEYTVVHFDFSGRPHFRSVRDAKALRRALAPCSPLSTPPAEER